MADDAGNSLDSKLICPLPLRNFDVMVVCLIVLGIVHQQSGF
jgi:hypothetical protein